MSFVHREMATRLRFQKTVGGQTKIKEWQKVQCSVRKDAYEKEISNSCDISSCDVDAGFMQNKRVNDE